MKEGTIFFQGKRKSEEEEMLKIEKEKKESIWRRKIIGMLRKKDQCM